jgi:uncharacterized protein (TIGR03435 family)
VYEFTRDDIDLEAIRHRIARTSDPEVLSSKPGADPVARQAALAAAADGPRPSLYIELQDKLGLKLESGKGPVSGNVVDSAHLPTES